MEQLQRCVTSSGPKTRRVQWAELLLLSIHHKQKANCRPFTDDIIYSPVSSEQTANSSGSFIFSLLPVTLSTPAEELYAFVFVSVAPKCLVGRVIVHHAAATRRPDCRISKCHRVPLHMEPGRHWLNVSAPLTPPVNARSLLLTSGFSNSGLKLAKQKLFFEKQIYENVFKKRCID